METRLESTTKRRRLTFLWTRVSGGMRLMEGTAARESSRLPVHTLWELRERGTESQTKRCNSSLTFWLWDITSISNVWHFRIFNVFNYYMLTYTELFRENLYKRHTWYLETRLPRWSDCTTTSPMLSLSGQWDPSISSNDFLKWVNASDMHVNYHCIHMPCN